MENFLEHLAFLVVNRFGWFVLYAVDTVCLYQIFARFAPMKQKWYWRVLVLGILYIAASMIIWVGDNNLLMTLPVFLAGCLLATYGDWVGRLTVSLIFFCIIMSCNAIIDTFLGWRTLGSLVTTYYDVTTRLARSLVWVAVYLLLRKRLPAAPPRLPRRIWRVILALSLMPLCSMSSIILLSYRLYDFDIIRELSLSIAVLVLPFTFLTSFVLLFAVLILSDHEELEARNRIANMRQMYYDAVQREQQQVRTLRHDLRNHLTVMQGLLEQDEREKAMNYLQQMSDSPALSSARQLCENETANIVLNAKLEEMNRLGLVCDASVSLPALLPFTDVDLCALLGNALDNAMEAAVQTPDRQIILRCRTEQGMLMLRVENAVLNPPGESLTTTKADKEHHGFGVAGMREIARRYGGSLETRAEMGRFELIVAIPLK